MEGKATPLEPGSLCAVPHCLSLAQQRHHCWARSFLRGQPYEWVHVGELTIPNTVGLCLTHHEWVTGDVGGHRAHIRWNPGLELLEWWQRPGHDLDADWECLGPLRSQAFIHSEPESHRVRALEGLCPTCGKPQKPRKALPKRKAKLWTISVPDDAEQGSDALDTYIEDLGVLMGLDPSSPRLFRYHVLLPVLEWVSQSRVEFLADWTAE